MSYCRWSSENFQCDLYCYQSNEGYVTHVAARRHAVLPTASLEEIVMAEPSRMAALLDQYNAWSRADHDMVPIGLGYDGRTFTDDTLEEFLATVTILRQTGYRVPDYVFDAIKEEMKDDS